MGSARGIVFGVAAVILGLVSAFFVFYEGRLLYVTRGLQAVRPGGKGAYIGAIAFPVVAAAFGWAASRCVRIARRG